MRKETVRNFINKEQENSNKPDFQYIDNFKLGDKAKER